MKQLWKQPWNPQVRIWTHYCSPGLASLALSPLKKLWGKQSPLCHQVAMRMRSHCHQRLNNCAHTRSQMWHSYPSSQEGQGYCSISGWEIPHVHHGCIKDWQFSIKGKEAGACPNQLLTHQLPIRSSKWLPLAFNWPKPSYDPSSNCRKQTSSSSSWFQKQQLLLKLLLCLLFFIPAASLLVYREV